MLWRNHLHASAVVVWPRMVLALIREQNLTSAHFACLFRLQESVMTAFLLSCWFSAVSSIHYVSTLPLSLLLYHLLSFSFLSLSPPLPLFHITDSVLHHSTFPEDTPPLFLSLSLVHPSLFPMSHVTNLSPPTSLLSLDTNHPHRHTEHSGARSHHRHHFVI